MDIYDKLSELYGLQDIVKNHLRGSQPLKNHDRMIREMKTLIAAFKKTQLYFWRGTTNFDIDTHGMIGMYRRYTQTFLFFNVYKEVYDPCCSYVTSYLNRN